MSAGTLVVNGNQSAATGAVTVASGATLGGSGTVSGAVTVSAGGAIRGDSGTGTGALRVNNAVTLTGAASNGAALQAQVTATGATAVASKLDLTGGAGNLSLDPTNVGKVRIDLKSSGWLSGQQYTVTLATVGTGQIRNNGVQVTSGSVIPQAEYDLVSDFGTGFLPDYALSVNGSNLNLTFTPVPEPTGIAAVAAGLLSFRAVVRRWRRSPPTPSGRCTSTGTGS